MTDTALPPTPEGVPLLGNGVAFSRDPFGAIEQWARYGDVVRLRFPGRTMYLVTDPDLIEDVLVERQEQFTIGRVQRATFSGIEDNALSANSGNRWKRLRRALHPAFTWETIEEYGARMAARTAEHAAQWGDERLDLHREMRLLTLRILGDTLLGVDVAGDERLIMDAADALVDRADPRRFGQLLPAWLPTPTERRFQRRVAALASTSKECSTRTRPATTCDRCCWRRTTAASSRCRKSGTTSSDCYSPVTTPRPWRSPTRGTN